MQISKIRIQKKWTTLKNRIMKGKVKMIIHPKARSHKFEKYMYLVNLHNDL